MAFSLARSTRRQTYLRDEREDKFGEAMKLSLRRGEMLLGHPQTARCASTAILLGCVADARTGARAFGGFRGADTPSPRNTTRKRRNDVASPRGTRGYRSTQTCVKPWTAIRFML